ncbi:MAG: tail tape measure protein [Novosphingobium sp.]
MGDDIEQLLVEVRASTAGFTADIAQMRGSFESIVVDGFGRAGDVLERGLLSAIRRGSLGFEDLRRIALSVIGDIAASAVQAAFGAAGGIGGGIGGGLGGGVGGGAGGLFNLGNILGAVLGLPGRATGGLVSAGRGYLVGERGPELFVPASAGRVEPNARGGGRGRDVRVSIQVVAPKGASAPESLQRSSRQVARIVRQALSEY